VRVFVFAIVFLTSLPAAFAADPPGVITASPAARALELPAK
jgi:hypothetical protein